MTLNLDHISICVDDGPAAERALADGGVQIGLRAIHTGQGTANACAFFDNAYLELLCHYDDDELRSDPVRPLGLAERLRWRRTGVSPFGIAFRAGDVAPPVATWSYEAPFLPRGAAIPIVTPPNALHVPLLFLIPATLPIRLQPAQEHRGKRRRVTRVTVSGPRVTDLNDAVAKLSDPVVVVLRTAADHHLELEWDGSATEGHDFRPEVPLTLRW